jgi:hypothetical protein
MAWFDKTAIMKNFLNDLISDVFVNNGWDVIAEYRVRNGANYAHTYLLSSLGSDDFRRNVGIAFGYSSIDGQVKHPEKLCFYTFEGYESLGAITKENLGTGDGVTDVFTTAAYPIKPDSVKVYIDDTLITEGYTVDYETGQVTFDVAPETDVVITIDYDKVKWDDITVTTTLTPTSPTNIMTAIYSATSFVFPSKPTVVSFTKDQSFGNLWYPESEIYYWGDATKDRIAMFFRLDPTPDESRVYFTPLYIGRIDPLGDIPQGNHIIIGGCSADDAIDPTNGKLGTVNIDYGPYTSNGNSTIQLQRSKGGARYQSHFLAFITHSKSADHPEGRFNPSRYSSKYHLSPVYVVHPENGFVGKFIDCYAVHPKNIVQLDELEVYEDVVDEVVHYDETLPPYNIYKVKHAPLVPGTLSVVVDGTPVPEDDMAISLEEGTITFLTSIAGPTSVVVASYQYKQKYRYTLPTAPQTPFVLNTSSPYNPIGLAIIKNEADFLAY